MKLLIFKFFKIYIFLITIFSILSAALSISYPVIIGNLIDRIIYGAVVDYLDFNIFGYNFPVFNLADIFIVVSIVFIIFQIIKGDKNEVSSKAR